MKGERVFPPRWPITNERAKEKQTERFAGRLAAVRRAMARQGIDYLLLYHLPNIRYLFNFTGSAALALLGMDSAHLVVDGRYIAQAQVETVGCEPVLSASGNESAAADLIEKLKPQRLGFESRYLPYHLYSFLREKLPAGVEFAPTTGMVEGVRAIKDEEEIALMQRALELTWRAFDGIIPLIKVGVSEKDLAVELEYKLLRGGADKLSFDIIVASGERSALPHGRASRKKIGPNEFVTFDFGIYLEGYASDMTRTVYIGKPDQEAIQVYQTVRRALERAAEEARPEMECRQLDSVARDYIEQRGYGKFFVHSTGHGIGLEVHEQPIIGQRQEARLAAGMVFTIEPGIYLPGWGGVRIEDVVALEADGCRLLTRYTRELIAIS